MVDASRLKSPLFLLMPSMSSSWLLSHDGSFLLIVVAQALPLLSLLCAGEDLPPSGNVDEGC
jgi:hypothetical protein